MEGSLMLSFSYCQPILPQDTVLKKTFNLLKLQNTIFNIWMHLIKVPARGSSSDFMKEIWNEKKKIRTHDLHLGRSALKPLRMLWKVNLQVKKCFKVQKTFLTSACFSFQNYIFLPKRTRLVPKSDVTTHLKFLTSVFVCCGIKKIIIQIKTASFHNQFRS